MTAIATTCADDKYDDQAEGCSYEEAASALLSPLHQATTPQELRAATLRRTNTLQDMHIYLHRLGLDLNGSDAINNSSNKNSCEGITTTTQENKHDINTTTNKFHIPPLIFHITGTKGKGSTLSLCESILRNAYGLNTGLFTSPHLVNICERIRINGMPISKEMFGRVYWSVRHKLEQFHDDTDKDTAVDHGEGGNKTSLPPLPTLPGYFRMLTLMAIYTFCHQPTTAESLPKIDVILLEVGMGGRYDATNVFEPPAPPITSSTTTNQDSTHPFSWLESTTRNNNERWVLVRGVTLIDYDHTRILGSTLSQIAWEKGGIYVHNKLDNIGMDDGGYERFVAEKNLTTISVTAASASNGEDQQATNQPIVFASGNNNSSEVLTTLDRIAKFNGSHLQVVHDAFIESFSEIGLQGEHQRSNAALAFAMCQYAINQVHHSSTQSMIDIQNALAKTFWPGRCHTLPYPISTMNGSERRHHRKLTMNLRCDGAHTPLSIKACIKWFRTVVDNSSSDNKADASTFQHKFLIFNCGHEKNPIPLIHSLYTAKIMFESIYFCHADFERPSAVPKRLEEAWTKEPLEQDVSGGEAIDDVTFENMCRKLQTVATTAADAGHHLSIGINEDVVTNLLAGLSAVTSWQETLAIVWKVIDLYSRHLGSGSAAGERDVLAEPPMKLVTGLNVKDALTSIQKGVTSTTNIEDGMDCDDSIHPVENKSVVVEVCVTGSLYIVGSALAAAGWEEGKKIDSRQIA
ncbi:hypothetical protein ACHAXH_003632 [Discostella pseudostelligera]